MKNKFFWIPAVDSLAAEGDFNAFLASHRVVKIERHFLPAEAAPGWCICVEWTPASEEPANAKFAAKDKKSGTTSSKRKRILGRRVVWPRIAASNRCITCIHRRGELSHMATKSRIKRALDGKKMDSRRPQAPTAWCAAAPGATRRRTAALLIATTGTPATTGTTTACVCPQLTGLAAAKSLTRSSCCLQLNLRQDFEPPRAGRDAGWRLPNVLGEVLHKEAVI